MKAFFDGLERFLWFCATLCLIVFSILTFSQVVSRMVGHPIIWAEEVARFSFIYMVFLGSAVGVRRGAHYAFNGFARCKSKKVVFLAKFTSMCFVSLLLAFLFCTSLKFIPQMVMRASSTLRIPVAVPYASIVIFSGMGCLFMFERIFLFLRDAQRGENESR